MAPKGKTKGGQPASKGKAKAKVIRPKPKAKKGSPKPTAEKKPTGGKAPKAVSKVNHAKAKAASSVSPKAKAGLKLPGSKPEAEKKKKEEAEKKKKEEAEKKKKEEAERKKKEEAERKKKEEAEKKQKEEAEKKKKEEAEKKKKAEAEKKKKEEAEKKKKEEAEKKKKEEADKKKKEADKKKQAAGNDKSSPAPASTGEKSIKVIKSPAKSPKATAQAPNNVPADVSQPGKASGAAAAKSPGLNAAKRPSSADQPAAKKAAAEDRSEQTEAQVALSKPKTPPAAKGKAQATGKAPPAKSSTLLKRDDLPTCYDLTPAEEALLSKFGSWLDRQGRNVKTHTLNICKMCVDMGISMTSPEVCTQKMYDKVKVDHRNIASHGHWSVSLKAFAKFHGVDVGGQQRSFASTAIVAVPKKQAAPAASAKSRPKKQGVSGAGVAVPKVKKTEASAFQLFCKEPDVASFVSKLIGADCGREFKEACQANWRQATQAVRDNFMKRAKDSTALLAGRTDGSVVDGTESEDEAAIPSQEPARALEVEELQHIADLLQKWVQRNMLMLSPHRVSDFEGAENWLADMVEKLANPDDSELIPLEDEDDGQGGGPQVDGQGTPHVSVVELEAALAGATAEDEI